VKLAAKPNHTCTRTFGGVRHPIFSWRITFAQQKNDKPKLLPRWDSPPEVTILEHHFGTSKKPFIDTSPDPLSPKGEPSSRVKMNVNPAVSLKYALTAFHSLSVFASKLECSASHFTPGGYPIPQQK
jgi:hypothetical protein